MDTEFVCENVDWIKKKTVLVTGNCKTINNKMNTEIMIYRKNDFKDVLRCYC